jgi:hypothetical protein
VGAVAGLRALAHTLLSLQPASRFQALSMQDSAAFHLGYNRSNNYRPTTTDLTRSRALALQILAAHCSATSCEQESNHSGLLAAA